MTALLDDLDTVERQTSDNMALNESKVILLLTMSVTSISAQVPKSYKNIDDNTQNIDIEDNEEPDEESPVNLYLDKTRRAVMSEIRSDKMPRA